MATVNGLTSKTEEGSAKRRGNDSNDAFRLSVWPRSRYWKRLGSRCRVIQLSRKKLRSPSFIY